MDSSAENAVLQAYYRKFISGSHILHYHHVLDAYGHLSFRHPFKPDVFVMSRNVAPALVSSPSDLVEYRISDAEPVSNPTPMAFAERVIHSETYKRHQDVHAVVHSHSEAVVPYTISGVPLKACTHMAPWLGTGAPVFDLANHLRAEDMPDMLVRLPHHGAALAACFDNGDVVALMRGHGLTVVAKDIESVVLRAVYTQKSAAIQTAAMTLQAAYCASRHEDAPGLTVLSDGESKTALKATEWSVLRPWELWVREVEVCGLYSNKA